MITDKFSNISIEDLKKKLSKTYDDVKQKGGKTLILNYYGTKVEISKQKKGYDVSPNIPGYVFWLFFLLVVIIFFCINNPNWSAVNSDNWPNLIIPPTLWGLFLGGGLYWIFAEIYVALKKGKIKEFIDSLNEI